MKKEEIEKETTQDRMHRLLQKFINTRILSINLLKKEGKGSNLFIETDKGTFIFETSEKDNGWFETLTILPRTPE